MPSLSLLIDEFRSQLLIWELLVLRPIPKFLAPVLPPAFAWNHRWTTPCGEQGLREYLAARDKSAVN